MRKIILASASPRRKELLEQIGLEFSIMPSYAKETYKETRPDKIVEELSALKAIDVADRLDDSYIVIGADTIVVADEKILGKPKDEKDAFLMLESLQGKTHQVYSGVTLVVSHGDKKIIKRFHEKTEVAVAEMTKEQIKAYVATGEPMDKAGAYAIQGFFAPYIKGLVGDYYNVVGLPLAHLMKEMHVFLS